MKAKKISVKATVSPEEILKEKGMTKDEWNAMLKERIKAIEADESLSEAEKQAAIGSTWGMMIVERDGKLKFVMEVVAESFAGGNENEATG